MISGSRDWNQRVVDLLNLEQAPEAPQLVLDTICELVPVDSFIVFRYHRQEVPDIFYQKLNERNNDLNKYLAGPYLLDPFYQFFLEGGESGVYTLKQLSPDHFKQSEYYQSYYKFSELRDEVNIFVKLSKDSLIAITLGRASDRKLFSGKELSILEDIEPVVQSLALRHWQNQKQQTPENRIANQRFMRAMNNFGKSRLSEKEREVLHLLLKGHSAKSTAQQMRISPGTVKLHRNSIYSKLNVSSQTELFSLFIDVLFHTAVDSANDPLVDYLSRRALL